MIAPTIPCLTLEQGKLDDYSLRLTVRARIKEVQLNSSVDNGVATLPRGRLHFWIQSYILIIKIV